ncbi:hypothetical protein P3T73_00165 [Kiritimatiellota bacterium B12222]|nr:hypothetical protein P3T73_00165 [Kiritimatiellota bacterium B12222]
MNTNKIHKTNSSLFRAAWPYLQLLCIPFFLVISACTAPESPEHSEVTPVPHPTESMEEPEEVTKSSSHEWEQTGWGGGGYYYATAFHPTREGVIYLAGDVAGVYKTEDYGQNWRMINRGLANYAVFSLAVDPTNPDTVYAATQGGLCKSTDCGETWELLPKTGPKELGIYGKKKKSIRSVAVDPSNGNIVYAASPLGKVYKSTNGGQTWQEVYTLAGTSENQDRLRLQFGKTNGDFYAGIWTPLSFPKSINPEEAIGIGFNFKGDRSSAPKSFALFIKGEGFSYRSRNLNELFNDDQIQDVVLKAEDFVVDPDFVKKHPEKAAVLPATPAWSAINRIDLSCVGDLPRKQYVANIASFFIATGPEEAPLLVPALTFTPKSKVNSYGNLRMGSPATGSIYSVAVSKENPAWVAAATHNHGVVLSKDHGETWEALPTPTTASNLCFDPQDPNTLYATFFSAGLWKSTDAGQTWTQLTNGISNKVSLLEVAVNPENSQDVYAIGSHNWNGAFLKSTDGGQSWINSSKTKADYEANPTLPNAGEFVSMSTITNISIDPHNPQQLFVSANWRCSFSKDGGISWEERIKGADISCVTDIQFLGDNTYVSVMDEGTLMSDNHGESWKQLWPLKYSGSLSGHNWRVRVTHIDGVDRIISTASPWDGKVPQLVVVSEDGGKSYQTTTQGLPDYRISANTMWGRGYPRALEVDPRNPQIVYMGIDGDPTPGKMGGGLFKSIDGGHSWTQLKNQPKSRRMYYGLSIDPTESQRIYWAGFGKNGGVYKSEDAGESWKLVFDKDQHLFNLLTTADGTVYAGGKQLYRSRDHGQTWETMTDLKDKRSIVGIEVHPDAPNTLWISANVWSHDAKGAIYKTTDGGNTWSDITGNIPFNHPQVLRYNPATQELWAGYVGIYKIKQ